MAGTYGNVTQNGEQDVDEEVGIATALEEHTQRRQDDGEDDLDDVAVNPQSVTTVLLCPLHDFPAHESPPQHGKGSGADAGGSGLQSYMGTHLAVKGMMAVVSKKVTVGSG